MTDSLVIGFDGLKVSVLTSLSLEGAKSWSADQARVARLQDSVIPTLVLKAPGGLERRFRLPVYGTMLNTKYSDGSDPIRRAVLLAVAGRTRVDMKVHGRTAAFKRAYDLARSRVIAAVSAAAKKKSFVERFELAARKPQLARERADLRSFLDRHPLLRESDVVECFRTSRREAIVKQILDS